MSFHVIDGGKGILPSLCVEVDFTNDPTNATRVWTDITTDVRALSYTRSGRNDVLQATATGTLSATLNNRAGNYDPSNAAGTHYPGVKRMRWIRVRAQWAGVTYPRWQGLVTAWNVSWPESGKDSIVQVTASDSLKILNLFDLGGKDYGAGLTSARVTAVCADAGVASSVSTGISSIPASGTLTVGTNALTHLQSVEDDENGRLFAAGDATITFQDRHYRLVNSAVSQGTIGDAAGEIPYRDNMSLVSDDANLWPQVIVTPAGGTAETASDSSSETSYYTRTYTRTLLGTSQSEALSAAQYLVSVYKDPAPKLPVLTLLPSRATSLWPNVLGAVNSQRFTFKRRATYGTISQDGFVEQVSDTIQPGAAFDVSLQLSAADDQAFWSLGVAAFGELGIATALVY